MIDLLVVQSAPDVSIATTTSSPANNMQNAVVVMANVHAHRASEEMTVQHHYVVPSQTARIARPAKVMPANVRRAGKVSIATCAVQIKHAMR